MTLTTDELNAVTQDWIDTNPRDIHFKSNVLLHMLLSKNKTIPGGKRIQTVLEYAESNGGSYSASTKLPVDKKEIYSAAFFGWSAYYGQATIDLDDQIQNNGDRAIVDLVRGKLNNAAKTIRGKMAAAVYASGATSKDLVGLGDLFSTVTSTAYGDIKEDDMADWKANVITSPENITFKVMQKIRQAATVDDNNEGMPDLYITTMLLKDAFERTLQSNQRWGNDDLAKAGFPNVQFSGVPIAQDNKCGTGCCYGLNTKFLDMMTHEKRNFTKPVWASPIDQPDTAVAYIRWAGQLVCSNRAAHCMHTGLTET